MPTNRAVLLVHCCPLELLSWQLLSFWLSLLFSAVHAFVDALLCAGPPWRREWLSTPVFLENSMDRTAYSPWSCKELDTTEWLTLSTFYYVQGAWLLLDLQWLTNRYQGPIPHGAHEMMWQKLYSWHILGLFYFCLHSPSIMSSQWFTSVCYLRY